MLRQPLLQERLATLVETGPFERKRQPRGQVRVAFDLELRSVVADVDMHISEHQLAEPRLHAPAVVLQREVQDISRLGRDRAKGPPTHGYAEREIERHPGFTGLGPTGQNAKPLDRNAGDDVSNRR